MAINAAPGQREGGAVAKRQCAAIPSAPSAAMLSVPPVTANPPAKLLPALPNTKVPAPLFNKLQLPALVPLPPLPLWSAMTSDTVCVRPAPGTKVNVPLPCRNRPEPKAWPLSPHRKIQGRAIRPSLQSPYCR